MKNFQEILSPIREDKPKRALRANSFEESPMSQDQNLIKIPLIPDIIKLYIPVNLIDKSQQQKSQLLANPKKQNFRLLKSSTNISGFSQGLPVLSLKEIKEEEVSSHNKDRKSSDSLRTESQASVSNLNGQEKLS